MSYAYSLYQSYEYELCKLYESFIIRKRFYRIERYRIKRERSKNQKRDRRAIMRLYGYVWTKINKELNN